MKRIHSHKHQERVQEHDECEEIYQKILAKKEYSAFLQYVVKKAKNDETIQNILKILKIARNISILQTLSLDNYSLTPEIPIKNIINSLTQEPTRCTFFFGEPQIDQTASQYVRMVYRNPEGFADAAYLYFMNDPSQLKLFTSILFPSLCGNFISDEHINFAYSFINRLIQMGNHEFAKPLIISFYLSSFLFIDTFWDRFFTAVDNMKNRPTLKVLYTLLLDTLKATIRYLSPNHTSLLMDILMISSEFFVDVFFLHFLCDSFQIYANENPSLKNVRILRTQLLRLSTFLINNIDSTAFNEISVVLQGGVSSLAATTKFVEYSPKGAVPFIFSPVEVVLFIKITRTMHSNGKPFNFSRVKKQEKLESFEPIFFDVYFNVNDVDKFSFLFKEDQLSIPEVSKETSRNWMNFSKKCALAKVEPEKMIHDYKIIDKDDTPNTRSIKEFVASVITPELNLYALKQIHNSLSKIEQHFETCITMQSQKSHLITMIEQLERYQTVISRYVSRKISPLPTDCSTEFFSEIIAIEKMEIAEDEKLLSLIQRKYIFDRFVRKLTIKGLEYREVVAKHAAILNKLDEKSLGERLWVISDVVNMILPLCKEKEWLLPLFFEILKNSKSTSFFHTYLCINKFKSTQTKRYTSLPLFMQTAWGNLSRLIDKSLKKLPAIPRDFVNDVSLFIK